MKNIRRLFYLSLLFITIGNTSCKKDIPAITPTPTDSSATQIEMTPYILIEPAHFTIPIIPKDNKMYIERIALGKKLFFDTRLSNNGSNCASCHQLEFGFSMPGLSAPDNGLTSLPLVNLAWYENFMWNGRIAGTLEDVMFMEITKRFETDIQKINGINEYREEFKAYYGKEEITANDISYALAQYMRVLVSRSTREDSARMGFIQLSKFEQAGKNIFFSERGDCFHCHVTGITTDNIFHNTGLDSFYTKEIDKGRYNVTGDPNDLGKFRTPNLRNAALRTHYMHDGRFTTLREVIEFYDNGFKRVGNIDPVMLKEGKENGLDLTEAEKEQLIAYLKTLTDYPMITDTMFQE